MSGKPLTEVLAGMYVNELHRMDSDKCVPWENLNDESRALHMGAMHSVVTALKLFNIEITVNERGDVTTKRIQPKKPSNGEPIIVEKRVGRRTLEHGTQVSTDVGPPKMTHAQSLQMGFTGDMCSECGSMQMTRNGSCLKCQSCGATTGCS